MEEQRLRSEEVMGGRRRLHNEELHNLYTSPNITGVMKSRMKWTGHRAHMEELRNAYRLLVRKPEMKRLLGRPRHRWEVNIRMDIKEIVWEVVDWIHLAKDRDQWQSLVNMVMNILNLWVP
jgi:hypothetical protein